MEYTADVGNPTALSLPVQLSTNFHEAVASNAKPEGRAMNRRVEFAKL